MTSAFSDFLKQKSINIIYIIIYIILIIELLTNFYNFPHRPPSHLANTLPSKFVFPCIMLTPSEPWFVTVLLITVYYTDSVYLSLWSGCLLSCFCCPFSRISGLRAENVDLFIWEYDFVLDSLTRLGETPPWKTLRGCLAAGGRRPPRVFLRTSTSPSAGLSGCALQRVSSCRYCSADGYHYRREWSLRCAPMHPDRSWSGTRDR